MTYRVIVIRKMSEFIERLENFTRGTTRPWYRGVKSHIYDLEPSAYRSTKFRNQSRQIEQRSLEAGRSKMLHFEETHKLNLDIDWFCFLQHQGTPTRLLDWTTELDMSIYFAFEEYLNNKAMAGSLPSVWVLKPSIFLRALEKYIKKGSWPLGLTHTDRKKLRDALFYDPSPHDSNFIENLDKQLKSVLDKIYIPFESSIVTQRAMTQGSCFIRFPLLNRRPGRFADSKLNKFVLKDQCFDDCIAQFVFISPTSMLSNMEIWNLRTDNAYPEVQNVALEIKRNLF